MKTILGYLAVLGLLGLGGCEHDREHARYRHRHDYEREHAVYRGQPDRVIVEPGIPVPYGRFEFGVRPE